MTGQGPRDGTYPKGYFHSSKKVNPNFFTDSSKCMRESTPGHSEATESAGDESDSDEEEQADEEEHASTEEPLLFEAEGIDYVRVREDSHNGSQRAHRVCMPKRKAIKETN